MEKISKPKDFYISEKCKNSEKFIFVNYYANRLCFAGDFWSGKNYAVPREEKRRAIHETVPSRDAAKESRAFYVCLHHWSVR